MKIVIFNHYAGTPDMAGGTRHFDLARQMVELGHSVTIVASGFDHASQRIQRLSKSQGLKEEIIKGVHFVWLWTPEYYGNGLKRILNMLTYSWHAWLSARRFPRPDVVVGSSVHPLAALSGWFVARHHRARYVFEVRDLWPQTLVDLGSISRWHPLVLALYAIEWFLYKSSPHIITLLPAADQYMVQHGAVASKIEYVPNGVDLEAFDLHAAEPCEEARYVDPGKLNFVYVGAHGLANGLETLLRAAQILAEEKDVGIQFTFIGTGPDKGRLQRLASEWGLTNVHFLEPVPKQKVPAMLKAADACCVVLKDSPLYRYGISLNKMYDYLAAGKPIVFAGSPANNPVLESGAGLAVPAEDETAFAQAVLQLATMDAGSREKMGQAGRRYAEQYHDIRVLAERYIQVLS